MEERAVPQKNSHTTDKERFIRFSTKLTAALPSGGVVNDTAVQSDDILPTLHKVSPPCVLNVLLQLTPQRTIVVESSVSIVNLTRRKDEAPTLAETNNVIHRALVVCLFVYDDSRSGRLLLGIRGKPLCGCSCGSGDRPGKVPRRRCKGRNPSNDEHAHCPHLERSPYRSS